MALTNFAALTADQKLVWSKDLWKAARDQAFITKFTGGENSVIQRITELTKTEKGEQAIMHLVADLVGDGVISDNEREGNEEELKSYNDKITIDLITNSVRNKGKLAEQKTVIKFREQAKDKLAYWLANRIDQLAILTLSGISYSYNNDGSSRVGSPFPQLAFAADVSAPTDKRYLVWDGTNKDFTTNSANSSLTTADTPSYEMLVQAAAYAKDHYVKPLTAGGKEYYVLFVKPGFMAKLKQSSGYQAAIIQAADRGMTNPFFTGGTVTVDGLVIHEHRLVFSTMGTATKWGGGTVEGSRSLLCGAQALGMADLGAPEWNEKEFEYGSSQGINIDKMLGFVKPKFYSNYDKSVQDFGVIAIDHAL